MNYRPRIADKLLEKQAERHGCCRLRLIQTFCLMVRLQDSLTNGRLPQNYGTQCDLQYIIEMKTDSLSKVQRKCLVLAIRSY